MTAGPRFDVRLPRVSRFAAALVVAGLLTVVPGPVVGADDRGAILVSVEGAGSAFSAISHGEDGVPAQLQPASLDELLPLWAVGPPLPPPTLKSIVAGDLQRGGYDIPIPLNDRVLSYIQLFQGRLHEFMEEGLKRGGRYLGMIQGVLRAEGLPLDLAYVPLVESAFKPTALSRMKARGVWQFMRGTAREHGLKTDWYIDERSDPEKATIAAAKYLKTLAQMFDSDWHLALASYNGGPARLQRAVARSQSDDFWALAGRRRLLPRETRDYVPMILAAIVIARSPAQYGFTLGSGAPAFDPLVYDKLVLAKPVDLRRIAEWSGVSVEDIHALNPELRRWTTPIRYPNYEVKVPAGTADRVRERLEAASDAEIVSLAWYTVKKGETLSTIARKLGVKRSDLAEANYLRTSARVSRGQKLIVPHEPRVSTAPLTARR